ncbi:MAG: hypothetical protein M0Q88_08475 [Bacilli bacterium]|nr:hypothetical protein [Bacilli bacterium]
MMYELLFVEGGIYYLRYYSDAESKGVNLKLSRENYLNWKKGKIER